MVNGVSGRKSKVELALYRYLFFTLVFFWVFGCWIIWECLKKKENCIIVFLFFVGRFVIDDGCFLSHR